MNNSLDFHLVIVIGIMFASGWFGGYLNYLHNFDTLEKDNTDKPSKSKYILLGIGSSFLVPAFLKMISSNLVSSKDQYDYLVFAGFCLIAAIFSRRFVTTIGEKILEAAKKAEKSAKENSQKIDATQLELTSAKERIEDVKLAVDIKNTDNRAVETDADNQKNILLGLANNYIEKTNVPDYSKRIKLKAELGRKMGEIVVRNNFSKDELVTNHLSEGLILALSYSVQLKPEEKDLNLLVKISGLAAQLYTKYSILISFDTLSRNNFIAPSRIKEVSDIVKSFRKNADASLLRKINDTLSILSFTGEVDDQ